MSLPAFTCRWMACSVQCSMCDMKCTGADAGAFAGACAVGSVHVQWVVYTCSVHCAVCCLSMKSLCKVIRG